MTVARLAISVDKKLARAIRRAAGKEATSAWLADAAIRKLRSQGLLDVVREWENEHGPILPRDLKAAARRQRRPR